MQNTRLITFILRHYLKFDKTQPFISITAILAFLWCGCGRYGAFGNDEYYEWHDKRV